MNLIPEIKKEQIIPVGELNVERFSIKKEADRNTELGEKQTSELLKEEKEPYHEDDLFSKWQAAAFTLDDSHHLLRLSLTQKNPVFQETHKYVFRFDNQAMLEKYNFLKSDILGYIRKQLRNSSIEIEGQLLEQNSSTKIRTSKDIFHEMTKINPSLQIMQQKFGLELES